MSSLEWGKIREKLTSLFDRDRSKFSASPTRDWLSLLAVLALLIIGASFFGYFTYENFLGGESSESAAKSIKTIDGQKLSRVIGDLALKEEEFRKLFESPPRISDPL